jgi:sugar lactone lactonase YvrE
MNPSDPRRIVATPAFVHSAALGEGALWDDRSGHLYWVDIASNRVMRFDPTTGTNLVFEVGQSVGTVVLDEQARCVLGLREGFACFDPETLRLWSIGHPKLDEPGNRFNDGKCDPAGRFWAGTMVEVGEPGSGNLYCMDAALRVTHKLGGVTISNGLCWSRAGTEFFYIDTPTYELVVFDFDVNSATLSHRRVLRHFEPAMGAPDGMTIDAEDHLWVALWGGNKVQRVHPRTGQVDFEVLVPAVNVTSCAFGGPQLQDLYITTARIGASDAELAAYPLAGSLFHARVPYRGVPATRFAGLAP